VSERRTWILAVLFAALAIWVVLVEGVRIAPAPPEWERGEKIVACGEAPITAIEIRAGDRTLAARRSGERWSTDAPVADRDRAGLAIADLAQSLCDLPILDRIAEPGALADYGLEAPGVSLVIDRAGGRTTLDLGAASPAQNLLYARFREDAAVLQVGVLLRHEVQKVLAAAGA
jgi:hypothetical protein